MRRVVTDQKPVLVERGGEAHVVVMSVAQYERLKAAQVTHVNWRERVDQTRKRVAVNLGRRALPPVEEVIAEMREERDGELLDLC